MAAPREFILMAGNGKGILATLDDQGVVEFAVQAGPQSPIRGTGLFNQMMDYFGSEVRVIHCAWRRSEVGEVSTNIDRVNELTAQGQPLTAAVLRAWSVTRAAKRGFTVASGINAIGTPGDYSKIEVRLERLQERTT